MDLGPWIGREAGNPDEFGGPGRIKEVSRTKTPERGLQLSVLHLESLPHPDMGLVRASFPHPHLGLTQPFIPSQLFFLEMAESHPQPREDRPENPSPSFQRDWGVSRLTQWDLFSLMALGFWAAVGGQRPGVWGAGNSGGSLRGRVLNPSLLSFSLLLNSASSVPTASANPGARLAFP